MAVVETIKIVVEAPDAQAQVDKLTKEFEELQAQVGDTNKELEETGKVADDASKKLDKTGKSAKTAGKGATGLSKGFKAIGTAFKALGIGLVIAALAALADILSRNQKVMDFIAGIMTTLELVFNAVGTAISNAYDSVVQATDGFDALGKVMGGLLTLILTPIQLQFFAIKTAIIALQLAWEKSFLGKGRPEKIDELQTSLDETKDKIVEIGTEALEAGKDIVANFGEAVTEVGALGGAVIQEISDINVKALKDQADAITARKNAAVLAEAQQERVLKQAQLEAEQLRQIRDDSTKSFEDRQKASEDLLVVLEEQEKATVKLAKIQTQAARDAVAVNNSVENQAALTRALTNEIDAQETATGFLSEQQAGSLALTKEELDLDQAIIQSKNGRNIAEKKFHAERIEDIDERFERLKEINEEERVLEEARLQSIIDNEQATVEARRTALEEIAILNSEAAQAEIEADEELAAKKKEIETKSAADKEAIRVAQEAKDKAEADGRLELLGTIGEGLQQLSSIAGEETVAGKALAVASALINTYVGITASLAKGGPLGIAQAVVVGLAGFAAVKQIVAVKVPGGAGGGAGGNNRPAPSRAPNFSAVGTSPATVGGQATTTEAVTQTNQTPVQAFVVSTEVTTQQALDRQAETNATIIG
jgi:hypothetical protein